MSAGRILPVGTNMAIHKKSLIGAATAKPKETDGASIRKPGAKPEEPAKPICSQKVGGGEAGHCQALHGKANDAQETKLAGANLHWKKATTASMPLSPFWFTRSGCAARCRKQSRSGRPDCGACRRFLPARSCRAGCRCPSLPAACAWCRRWAAPCPYILLGQKAGGQRQR